MGGRERGEEGCRNRAARVLRLHEEVHLLPASRLKFVEIVAFSVDRLELWGFGASRLQGFRGKVRPGSARIGENPRKLKP